MLVFVPRSYHLRPAEEKSHYDQHQNDPQDTAYRDFLGRLLTPMLERLESGAEGLDFGSGPGPTLWLMFHEAGYSVRNYDLFYNPDRSVLDRQYEFVTATEVVEHLADPATSLALLWGCVKPGGWLGLMTKMVLDADAFGRWHYKNDPTHISFFSRDTFAWLGRCWQSRPHFFGNDVILFRKSD